MNLQRGFFHLFNLCFLLAFTRAFEIYVGEILYQFSKDAFLGGGLYSQVYEGKIIDGEKTDNVAFKKARPGSANDFLEYEKNMYQSIGLHDQIPKFYNYFHKNGKRVIIVTELLGENLSSLLDIYQHFSIVTTMKIGLQVLDVLEYLHKERHIVHNDIHVGNFALSHNNDSKICLFDFNLSKKYKIIGKTIQLVEIPFNRRGDYVGSPQLDLLQFARMLEKLLKGDQDSDSFEGAETLTEFKNLARSLNSKEPDYDANEFRNILQTELEKHRNESDYDKFDWQKHE